MRSYPALEVAWPDWLGGDDDDRVGLVLAAIDDEHPIAVEATTSGIRLFFASPVARGRAAIKVTAGDDQAICTPVDVPDDGWAARSQASLGPVTVGRITVAPPTADVEDKADLVVRIQASMGFGTGHHASTRVMLELMQREPLTGRSVVDVGTGSGVLAIAARALGARDVVALDVDSDALQAARENLALNGDSRAITMAERDLADAPDALQRAFDLVLANLTGAAITRGAGALARLALPAGRVIVSGFQMDETDAVSAALGDAGWRVADQTVDDGWVGFIAIPKPSTTS
jgi:ribosomal protein L11 methyltransferase